MSVPSETNSNVDPTGTATEVAEPAVKTLKVLFDVPLTVASSIMKTLLADPPPVVAGIVKVLSPDRVPVNLKYKFFPFERVPSPSTNVTLAPAMSTVV